MGTLEMLKTSKERKWSVDVHALRGGIAQRHTVVDHVKVAATKPPLDQVFAAAREVQGSTRKQVPQRNAPGSDAPSVAHDLGDRPRQQRRQVGEPGETVHYVEAAAQDGGRDVPHVDQRIGLLLAV